MEVVDYPTLAPSVCIVCEGVPPGLAFVDTLRSFNPAGFTHLNGRKYVCESCVTDAANALDLFEVSNAPALAQVALLESERDQLQVAVSAFSSIQDALDQLKTMVPAQALEASMEEAVDAAKAKRSARSKAAQAAQDAANTAQADAEAGAIRQAQLDQEAADKQQADVDAKATPGVVVEPDLTVTPPGEPALGPVVPVGQNPPDDAPVPGQIYDGTAWVDPPVASVVDLTK